MTGDKIHAYGSYISAKFLIRALEDYFERRAACPK